LTDCAYHFRPAAAADMDLVRRWRAQPHVREFWGPPEVDDFAETLADPRVAKWIVELETDGKRWPFAYAQDYAPADWEDHPFAYLPPGSRGIDHFIGEPDLVGRGHGSAFVRAHCERLFAAGAPAAGTDPHPDNRRAIRAYQKAGFRLASEPKDTRWGRAILMENWRPD
jgi:aminoglycoside 6'-N-acetyltransferase